MGGIIRRREVVLSGTRTRNLLADETFLRLLRVPSRIKFSATQEIVIGSSLSIDLNVGNVIGSEDLVVNTAVTVGVVDESVDALPPLLGMALDEVQIGVRETTGGPGADGILNWKYLVEDL